jgi:hopanoid biosynthesis associated RND transporter like protein HpnN
MERLGKLLLGACATATTRRPWLVLIAVGLVTVAAGYASLWLSIDTSTDKILAADLPFRKLEQAYEAAFPREDAAVAVVDAAAPEQSDAATRALAQRLRGRPDLFTTVKVPGDDPYFNRAALLFLDRERLRSVTDQLIRAEPLLATLGGDPSLRGLDRLLGLLKTGITFNAVPPEFARVLSNLAETTAARTDGRVAAMDWNILIDLGPDPRGARRLLTAQPVLDYSSLQPAGPALAALRSDVAAVHQDHPGVTVRLTGDPVLRQQELDDALSGALYASGLSFILVALSLVVGIRSGRLIVVLMLTLIIGSVWTTGLAAVAVGRLNLISVAFMVLFFGLGVDFGTHLGLRYLEEAKEGVSFEQALTRAMFGEGGGISLSALCATLGFLSFVPTDYVGLAEFGIISALGMVVAVAITFTVQPALMAVLPPRKSNATTGMTLGLGRFIQRHYRSILVLTALVTIAAAFAAGQARIDVNPLNLQNPAAEPVRTYRDLAKNPETSPYSLNVLAPNAAAAEALASRLAAVEGVAGARTAASFVPQDQPAKIEMIRNARSRLASALDQPQRPPLGTEERQQALESLRTTSAAIASAVPADSPLGQAAARLAAALEAFKLRRSADPQALEGLEAALIGGIPDLMRDLRERLSISAPVSVADLSPDFRRQWIAPDGRWRIQVQPAGDISSPDALDAFAQRVTAVAPQATGVPVIVEAAGDVVLRAFAEAIAYTTIAIALVVVLIRRNLADVLLVLAPLALASVWTVAASALFDLPFNFANVIVIPMLIGLGVASSVHMVVRARELTHEPGGAEAGVMDTSTPLAVLVAQLNTVGAFATLAVSAHRGLFSMGLLLGLAILLVLIASLIVLPAAMKAIWRPTGGSI